METSVAIGVDLGATKIAAALVTEQGQVLARGQSPTRPERGAGAILDDIAAHIRHLSAQAQRPPLGVGIGLPGQVFSQSGIVRHAVNLGWEEVHVTRELRDRLNNDDLPIYLHKDGNASVVGEYTFGAGQGCRDLIYLCLGSGLGCGLLVGGRLVIGASSIASDIGHLVLDPHGRPCVCGLHGCAETIASGPGLLAETRQRLQQGGWDTSLQDDDSLTPVAIVEAARKGDELARAALERVACAFGQVMAICVAVLNPQRFVIGGGLALAAYDLLVPRALQELPSWTLVGAHKSVEVMPSGLESSAVGAASLVWYAQLQDENERR